MLAWQCMEFLCWLGRMPSGNMSALEYRPLAISLASIGTHLSAHRLVLLFRHPLDSATYPLIHPPITAQDSSFTGTICPGRGRESLSEGSGTFYDLVVLLHDIVDLPRPRHLQHESGGAGRARSPQAQRGGCGGEGGGGRERLIEDLERKANSLSRDTRRPAPVGWDPCSSRGGYKRKAAEAVLIGHKKK